MEQKKNMKKKQSTKLEQNTIYQNKYTVISNLNFKFTYVIIKI